MGEYKYFSFFGVSYNKENKMEKQINKQSNDNKAKQILLTDNPDLNVCSKCCQ